MCGFVCYCGNDLSEAELREATKTLTHRGPDDQGLFLDRQRGIGLGHTRLSIIDLEKGQQPMSKNGVSIVYNGEIYNYPGLRDTLSADGFEFTTTSDTEVLIQGYRRWGKNCLERLNGMFSFVIYDENEQLFFLARDRHGQKPLHYYSNGNKFAAASEIRALLSFKGVSRKLNQDIVPLYLGCKYIPSPHSGFRDLRKLPPASYMTVHDGHIQEQKRYWRPRYEAKRSISFPEACREFEDRFRNAVRMRMRSDVPVGAFLSGGIDSSLTVAFMAMETSRPVNTFSIGFDEDSQNELPLARKVARKYDTNHHEYKVTPDVKNLLPKLVEHYGEPFADSSAVPTYYVARETGKNVKVALTGDGGDEGFGGYPRFQFMRYRKRLHDAIPSPLRKCAGSATAFLPENWNHSPGLLRTLKRGLRGLRLDDNELYTKLQASTPYSSVQKLVQPEIQNQGVDRTEYMREKQRELKQIKRLDERCMALESVTYLPEDLLVKLDIASMMNSLECRSPFLDHQLFQFAICLPVQYKIGPVLGNTKRLLKAVGKRYLPGELLSQPKMGFGIPTASWLKHDLKTYSRDVLLSRNQDGFFSLFSRNRLQTILDRHQKGNGNYDQTLWSLMMFRLWMNRFNVER